ncbi:MAG: nicotinate (nicotinamide) nucleotide adenylyltransferase [Rikenellaceae bacterium]
MHIVLYFGSYNPIHKAHLKIAAYLSEQNGVDEVWMVVSPHNPMKPIETLAPENHRLEMARQAIVECKIEHKVKVCDIEFSLPKPSYTYQTLKLLREKYPHHTFSMLIGSDNLSLLNKWKCSEVIISTTKIYVYPRNGYSCEVLEENGANFEVLNGACLMDISSTEIRDNHQCDNIIETTKKYIKEHDLYRRNP